MAKRPAKVHFEPTNPQKYLSPVRPIIARSGWEVQAMMFFDRHPNVVGWASEPVSISYYNPLAQTQSFYKPDFLIVYEDKNGRRRKEIIEIKPAKEHPLFEGKVSEQTKLVQVINAAKWDAAAKWCAKRGITFRVMTEQEMFGAKKR